MTATLQSRPGFGTRRVCSRHGISAAHVLQPLTSESQSQPHPLYPLQQAALPGHAETLQRTALSSPKVTVEQAQFQ